MRAWVAGALLLFACLGGSRPVEAARAFDLSDEKTRLAIQYCLIWTGHYSGLVDGDFGRITRRAIVQYQRDSGFEPTGELTDEQISRLVSEADKREREVDFKLYTDDRAELSVRIPMGKISTRSETDRGHRLASQDSSLEIETLRFSASEMDLDTLRARIEGGPIQRLRYRVHRGGVLVLAGEGSEKAYYFIAISDGKAIKGFSVSYPAQEVDTYDRIVTAMVSSLQTTPVVAPESGSQQEASTAGPELTGTGSGFFVTASGHVVTNAHVVEKCGRILVRGLGEARLLRADTTNDLALLQVDARSATPFASLRTRPVVLGEPIIAIGYPLSQILGGVNVTSGIVSSLAGVQGDSRYVQISAAVQPGNSGGPLVDQTGAVIGVVSSKLSQIADVTPENVNFAIRSGLLASFLSAQNIQYAEATGNETKGPEGVATQVGRSTVLLECWN